MCLDLITSLTQTSLLWIFSTMLMCMSLLRCPGRFCASDQVNFLTKRRSSNNNNQIYFKIIILVKHNAIQSYMPQVEHKTEGTAMCPLSNIYSTKLNITTTNNQLVNFNLSSVVLSNSLTESCGIWSCLTYIHRMFVSFWCYAQ